jgi:hypothetical protein
MRLRTVGLTVASMALLAASMTPAHAETDVAGSGSAAAREPAQVTVPLRMMDGPRLAGQSGVAEIRLGGSAPIPVVVDTGFTGLILFPNAWTTKPGGVSLGTKGTSAAMPGGTSVKGFPGSAPMTINGVTTVFPIQFVYTNSDSPFFDVWRNVGVRGLMGVGTKGSAAMVNPLSALPGELGLRWSLHLVRDMASTGGRNGSLVLGAEAPTEPSLVYQLPYIGENVNGAAMWNDHAANGCWKFGATPEACVPTTFDSAFTTMRIVGRQFGRVPQDSRGMVRPGTRIGLAAEGSAFTGWSITAGRNASADLARVVSSGKPAVNTGNAPFFDFTVTYNVATGRVYLSDPIRKAGR